MIAVHGLFEAHLNVADLGRALVFYGERLGLELAHLSPERGVAFYWLGAPGHSMLGLWEVGTSPQRMALHVAFSVGLAELLRAPQQLQSAGIAVLDSDGNVTAQPVVFGWMPAASVFFRDPDGNLLEFLSMLPDAPQPELGVLGWNEWLERKKIAPR